MNTSRIKLLDVSSLPFPELQPRTKLLRQFHVLSNFCALLPSPLNRKSTPPPHPQFLPGWQEKIGIFAGFVRGCSYRDRQVTLSFRNYINCIFNRDDLILCIYSLTLGLQNMKFICSIFIISARGGGGSHMKGAGMLIGHAELKPLKRPIWAWPTFFWPQKETILNFDYTNRVNKTNWKYIIFYISSRVRQVSNHASLPSVATDDREQFQWLTTISNNKTGRFLEGSKHRDTSPLTPKIHIHVLQTDFYTFLLRIVERIWFKIKAFFLW